MSVSQRQTALNILRSRILCGEVAAGTKLRASHLANELEISRTPISEALQSLEKEGLLLGDKSGFTVPTFSIEEVYTAIDLRGLLEASAAQMAAEKGISKEQSETLHDYIHLMEQIISSGETEAYDDLNDKFHAAITDCSGSKLMKDEVERSYRFPFAAPSAFPSGMKSSSQFASNLIYAHKQHKQIVEAIEAREGSRAFALLREHSRLAYDNVAMALKENKTMPQLALVKT